MTLNTLGLPQLSAYPQVIDLKCYLTLNLLPFNKTFNIRTLEMILTETFFENNTKLLNVMSQIKKVSSTWLIFMKQISNDKDIY